MKKSFQGGLPHREHQGRPPKLNDQIKHYICIIKIQFPEISGADLVLQIHNIHSNMIKESERYH